MRYRSAMPATPARIERFPVLPVVAGFLLLLAMVGSSLWFAREQASDNAESARLFRYQFEINEILSALKDAEIGQRGFLLTADARYLEPFHSAVGRMPPALAAIGRYPTTASRSALVDSAEVRFREVVRTVELARGGRFDQANAIVRTNAGKASMDEVRRIVAAERETARAAVLRLSIRSVDTTRWLTIGLVLGLIALIVTAWATRRTYVGQLATLAQARDTMNGTNAALVAEASAREQAEGQLRQMQKMESIGQLTGGIAHDFNNMLAIVIGGLDLAERRLTSDPEKARTSIGHAREGAERASSLTARLLAYSRKQPLAPDPVDANKLVAGMSELLRRTLGETIEIETVLAGGLWRAHVDVGQLENALINLAINARDAMPDGGKLTIETANAHLDDDYARSQADVIAGQYVLICVTDTGSGMPQQVIDQAFDPFFTTKGVGKGTGLGLSQVYGYVKQSGGHVAIYSEVGHGTTVKLYLPRFTGVDDTGAARGANPDRDTPLGRADEIILVVEDEQRVRHFAVDALRELGYTALSAASPAEALRTLAAQPTVAMLFTDIVMPEMDGRRLADAARSLRPGIKVLYTTGYTRNAVVHDGRLDAGVQLLSKPYSIAQLARKIRTVLDG